PFLQADSLKVDFLSADQRPKEGAVSIRYTPEGKANYDIVKPTASQEEDTTSSTAFQIALQSYELVNCRVSYADPSLPAQMSLSGLNHSGKGDFTATRYQLETLTHIDQVSATYDGVSYLRKAGLDATINLDIEQTDDLSIRFLDNSLTLNDLTLGMLGSLIFKGEDMVMDLSFEAPEADLKSLYSLVPGVYKTGFEAIQADGNGTFKGHVKGTYNEQQLPGFGLLAQVVEGRLQYPDLPKPITNIDLNLAIDNPDGVLEHTSVDLQKFHADLGQNPIDAQLKMQGLERLDLDGKVNARLNLAEITQFYPLEGTQLKGDFFIDAVAKGIYDEKQEQFPTVSAKMEMAEGYLKEAEYPTEITDLHFKASLEDADGSMAHAVLEVPDFHFDMDGEPLDGQLTVSHFEDPTYDLKASGRLDLEKLMQIYPIDSMSLAGKIIVHDFETRGKYSDLEAERYAQLPTKGSADIQNLRYSDLWYMQPGFSIDQGTAVFTNDKLSFQGASGKMGKSDYQASGYLTNYLAYALWDDQDLGGAIDLRSKRFDVDEWLTEEEPVSPAEEAPEEPLTVIPVPETYDLNINAAFDELIYGGTRLANLTGQVKVADQRIALSDISCAMLGGQVGLNGVYNTEDLKNPTYNFYLDMNAVGIQNAYQYFSSLQAYAPLAKLVQGKTNLEFGIAGRLKENMMPVIEDINSLGVFEILEGKLAGSKIMSALAEKTKINELKEADLSDLSGQFEIKDGFILISPLEIDIKGIKLTIGGRQNLAGKLDYDVTVDAPSGSIGNAAFSALSNLSGGGIKASERVVVNLLVGGTLDEPQISGGAGGTGDALKDQATALAEDKLKEQLGSEIELEKDSLKQQVDNLKNQVEDSVKQVIADKKTEAKDSLNQLTEKAKQEAAQKLEEEAKKRLGDDATEALKSLKDKFGFPKKKKKK
ncbi:MAG: AsmA-like C-terminal region-containing protein, partial [Bacteroidota bacterium]